MPMVRLLSSSCGSEGASLAGAAMGWDMAARHHDARALLPECVMASLWWDLPTSYHQCCCGAQEATGQVETTEFWASQAVTDQSRIRHEECLLAFELGSHGAVCSWERKHRDDSKCQQSMNMLVGFN